jgi:hypothetical protein
MGFGGCANSRGKSSGFSFSVPLGKTGVADGRLWTRRRGLDWTLDCLWVCVAAGLFDLIGLFKQSKNGFRGWRDVVQLEAAFLRNHRPPEGMDIFHCNSIVRNDEE